MIAHPVLWASPQPFWGRFRPESGGGPASFMADDQSRPAILRFKTDDFMERVFAVLAADPRQLGDAIARPETWRNPGGELIDVAEPTPLPRLARVLKRLRRSSASADPIDATTGMARETTVNGAKRDLPLKLYHPAHQRHYLVAAHLVCGIPGFPEKGIATGGRELIGFVLRRLVRSSEDDAASEREYAFVKDGLGPRWKLVAPDAETQDHYARAVDGEELLPLFPLNFADDVGHPRRLLAGNIPVGRREEYMATRFDNGTTPQPNKAQSLLDTSDPAQTKKSARKEQLKMDVSEPWKGLIRAMYKTADRINSGKAATDSDSERDDKRRASVTQANEGAQHQSWLILLDFADYLATHVPEVWEVVKGRKPASSLTDLGQKRLHAWLIRSDTRNATPFNSWWLTGSSFATSMLDALNKVSEVRKRLEDAESTFVTAAAHTPAWPDFFYLLAGVREMPSVTLVAGIPTASVKFAPDGVQSSLDAAQAPTPKVGDLDVNPETSGAEDAAARAENAAAHVDKLVQLVVAALDADATTVAPPVPFGVQLRDALASAPDEGDTRWFTLRCVYTRCDCGPLQPTVFSAPSQRFQLASFFDSDAPARPIRIALPIDTTAAGMRKYQKNTAFMLSDALCGQVNRMKGLGLIDLILHVLPWPFHKDLDLGDKGLGPCKKDVNFGMICSLSIPIITICALILLLMIVLVLDFVFHWIPFFIICWPLPGFRAKKA